MLPIFRYKGDKDDTSSKLLDMEVNSKLTVPEFKAELAAKLIAEVKGFEDLPADGSRLRVRKLDYSSAVFMDDQTVQQAFNVMFTGREKLGVSVLSGPEEKTDKDQVRALCCVGRVCQSACADRALLNSFAVDRFGDAVAAVDDGVGAALGAVRVVQDGVRGVQTNAAAAADACGASRSVPTDAAMVREPDNRRCAVVDISDIGLLKKSYTMDNVLDVWKGAWDADRAAPRTYTCVLSSLRGMLER